MRIHIDQHPYNSPNPTLGESLYRLGNIPAGLWLYREVTGDREDPLVPNGPEMVHLKHDQHFHSGLPSKEEVTIIVNGTRHEVPRGRITYAQVVTLDVPDYPEHPEINYSVKYTHGPKHKPEGTLSPGGSVEVREGMVFCVTPTGQS